MGYKRSRRSVLTGSPHQQVGNPSSDAAELDATVQSQRGFSRSASMRSDMRFELLKGTIQASRAETVCEADGYAGDASSLLELDNIGHTIQAMKSLAMTRRWIFNRSCQLQKRRLKRKARRLGFHKRKNGLPGVVFSTQANK